MLYIYMRTTDKYILFWSGILSNWANTPYKAGGKEWCCSEQQYMWFKAIYFHDHDTAAKILASTNPKEIKRLGRRVRNYNDEEWDSVRCHYMAKTLEGKFTGNKKARNFLLKQPEGHIFVEASPYDTIWGIGLAEDDPRAWNNETWRGRNCLGACLTMIYHKLKKSPNLFDDGNT